MSNQEKLREALKNLITALEDQVDASPEGTRALMLQKHAEILAWERALERQEELHEAQVAFWRRCTLPRLWKGRA